MKNINTCLIIICFFTLSLVAGEEKININGCSIYDFNPIKIPYSLAKIVIIERNKKRYFSNWDEIEKIQGMNGYITKIKERFYIADTIIEDKLPFEKSSWTNFVQVGVSSEVADKIVLYRLKIQKEVGYAKNWSEIEKIVGKEIVKLLQEKFYLEGEEKKITINLKKER